MTQTKTAAEKSGFRGINSLTLHILAMALMLCDHLWATVVPGQEWLTWLGRIAFPIFAYLIAEGYFHTHDVKKYLLRMLGFALLSEIPFNLMMGGSIFYPYHQNVLWTFLIALLCIVLIEKVRKKNKIWLTALTFVAVALGGTVVGTLAMVDYFGFGVLTVLVFYLFHGRKWWQMLGQLLGLYWINWVMLGGLVVPITVLGHEVEFVQQGFALLALIPIWLYRGRQGPHNKPIQYACYAFYPVHLLILALVALL